LEHPRQHEIDTGFCTWNVRSLYRTGSLKTVTRKLEKYNLDLVAVQEIRWDEVGSQPADGYTIFYGNGKPKYHMDTSFFLLHIRQSDQQLLR